MGDKVSVPVSVPISKGTTNILFNKNLIACLDASDEVIALYKVTDAGSKVLLSGKEAAKALNAVNIGVSNGAKAA